MTQTSTLYRCNGYFVVNCNMETGGVWHFSMGEDDIGAGAFYPGSQTVVAADNSAIVGVTFSGFYSYFDPANDPYNTLGSWYDCEMNDDLGWWCVHDVDGVITGCGFTTINGAGEIPENTDLFVVSGSLQGPGGIYSPGDCLVGIEVPVNVYGFASVFTIGK